MNVAAEMKLSREGEKSRLVRIQRVQDRPGQRLNRQETQFVGDLLPGFLVVCCMLFSSSARGKGEAQFWGSRLMRKPTEAGHRNCCIVA